MIKVTFLPGLATHFTVPVVICGVTFNRFLTACGTSAPIDRKTTAASRQFVTCLRCRRTAAYRNSVLERIKNST